MFDSGKKVPFKHDSGMYGNISLHRFHQSEHLDAALLSQVLQLLSRGKAFNHFKPLPSRPLRFSLL